MHHQEITNVLQIDVSLRRQFSTCDVANFALTALYADDCLSSMNLPVGQNTRPRMSCVRD